MSDPLEVSYHPNIRRELPRDLSDKALRKEAALVLSQADKAKNGQHITLTRTSSDPKRRKEGRINFSVLINLEIKKNHFNLYRKIKSFWFTTIS